MNLMQMESMARKHMIQYRPQQTAMLRAEGLLTEHCHGMARLAHETQRRLMSQNYRQSEAEEVALLGILVAPEPDADMEDWEREELAQKEADYQKMMAPYQDLMEPEADLEEWEKDELAQKEADYLPESKILPDVALDFLSFEESYKKAKPHFQAALAAFQRAGKTLQDLMKWAFENFGAGIKPYIDQFAMEQKLKQDLGKGDRNEPQTDGGHLDKSRFGQGVSDQTRF